MPIPVLNDKNHTQPHAGLETLKSSTFLSSIRAFGKKLRRNEEGVAAIEFALIAPVMLFIYFGLYEIFMLVDADRRVTQAASLVGDLASQEETLTLNMMENYINAAIAVIGANQSSVQDKIGIEISSFEAIDNGGTREINEIGFAEYGVPFDGGTITTPDPLGGPDTAETAHYDPTVVNDTLLPTGSGIVVARVNYEYHSPLQYFVKNVVLRETFFLKPRLSPTVIFDNGNASDPLYMDCSMNERSTGSGTYSINCTDTPSNGGKSYTDAQD